MEGTRNVRGNMATNALNQPRQSRSPLDVSLLAVPNAAPGPLAGALDVLSSVNVLWQAMTGRPPAQPLFRVELVGLRRGSVICANGLTISVSQALADLAQTDIVYVPSLAILPTSSPRGHYPEVVAWLREMFAAGALVCSTCSGSMLLAEAGLLHGQPATTHWGFVELMQTEFPDVRVHPEQILVEAGAGLRVVTAAGGSAWQDLVLYLVARFGGQALAVQTAKAFLLPGLKSSQLPYAGFREPTQHGDAAVEQAQARMRAHLCETDALEQALAATELPERTYTRRFKRATGLAPIAYLQRLRIERARELLELTALPVEEIGPQVGYEDAAHFRRLFKRLTGLAPGAYRRRFRQPSIERS